MHESLPRVWIKADLNSEQCDKFKWNGDVNNAKYTGISPNMDPTGYVELVWDNDLFEKIQNFSKLYAAQQDPKSSYDVTVEELKVMVGILLISGYNTAYRVGDCTGAVKVM